MGCHLAYPRPDERVLNYACKERLMSFVTSDRLSIFRGTRMGS
jgi:hypothetical protein